MTMNSAAAFTAEKTLGCWGRFAHPIDVKVNDVTGMTYVLNRSTAWNAPHGRAVGIVAIDPQETVAYEFGQLGTDPGHLFMPTAMAIGRDRRIYVSDEHLNAISVFEHDGTFVTRWGKSGSASGEFNRPSGLAFDSRDRLFIVDHANARVQSFTPQGEFVDSFGRLGIAPGEFQLPWGVAIDTHDTIWVADWGNDRIQSFTVDGHCLAVIGGGGDGAAFRRPSAVATDEAGNVYVCDWGHDRVLVFDRHQDHVDTWHGDSELSSWAVQRMKEFPIFDEQRKASGLYEQERRFWRPSSITVRRDGLVLVVDSCRHRIQSYQRTAERQARRI